MAKIIAPFQIKGTLDDLNFYIDQAGKDNIVRTKGKTGVSSEQFKKNPAFTKVRNHGLEFGRCIKKGMSFRQIAQPFFLRAKDGSFSGRANKLMFDILLEDGQNIHGKRTVENGLETLDGPSYCIGFEGNKLRPLDRVLKSNWTWNPNQNCLTINNFTPAKNIDWPTTAQQVHLAVACADWNYYEDSFTIEYSEEIILKKENPTTDITLHVPEPVKNHFELVYLFIGFSFLDRKRVKELKRVFNTVSIISSRNLSKGFCKKNDGTKS